MKDLAERLSGDLGDLQERIIALAEINSGSFNPDGVAQVGERLADMVGVLQPDVVDLLTVEPTPVLSPEGIAADEAVGPCFRAVKRPDAPLRICLFGHLDTVFPADHPFQSVEVDGWRLNGPGVADCKGGLVIALEVLRYLETTSWGQNIGWEFLAVSEEEVGSFGSKKLLKEAAELAAVGFGFEPALPSGGVAGARKGSVTGHLVVHGLAAHAGRAHHEGRSSILALSNLIVRLEALNSEPGVTVNCGKISGGGPLNVVPDLAVGSFNMRVETPADQAFVEAQFVTAAAESDLDVDLVWGSTRPPKVRTPELDALFDALTQSAQELGIDVPIEDTGGCCDGNDLAAAGLPNVDSLGIRGGAIHSANEFAFVDSVPERAALVASMIEKVTQ